MAQAMGTPDRRWNSPGGAEEAAFLPPLTGVVRRLRIPTAYAVGCPVTALLTIGGAGTFEGPSAGMSAGAAGEIARATEFNPATRRRPG
jgi:hypothetical protein